MAKVRAVSTRILGKPMRDAVRNKERWKRRVRLPKILVLTWPSQSPAKKPLMSTAACSTLTPRSVT